MVDLVLLTYENGDYIPCTDINDAKSKALAAEGKILVEITPVGRGGPIRTLEFNRGTQDWIST